MRGPEHRRVVAVHRQRIQASSHQPRQRVRGPGRQPAGCRRWNWGTPRAGSGSPPQPPRPGGNRPSSSLMPVPDPLARKASSALPDRRRPPTSLPALARCAAAPRWPSEQTDRNSSTETGAPPARSRPARSRSAPRGHVSACSRVPNRRARRTRRRCRRCRPSVTPVVAGRCRTGPMSSAAVRAGHRHGLPCGTGTGGTVRSTYLTFARPVRRAAPRAQARPRRRGSRTSC